MLIIAVDKSYMGKRLYKNVNDSIKIARQILYKKKQKGKAKSKVSALKGKETLIVLFTTKEKTNHQVR